MKKALLIKLEAQTYSSIGMENAFKDYFEVESVDWQYERFNNGDAGVWQAIISKAISFMPDIIFCQFQKPDVLTTEQFKRLAEIGFVINYTEDVREDISWYEEVGEFIGLTIFTNKDDVKRFKHNNVGYMMVSYNDVWYKPQPKTDKYYGDIVFIGNNYENTALEFPQAGERQLMIEYMKKEFGDRFQDFGMGQSNQMLLPEQVREAYNNANVVITHSNFKKDGYMSDRGLNSMGCGAVTIHQHFEGVEEMFKDSFYLTTWKTFEGLKRACDFYLWHHNPLSSRFHKYQVAEYTKDNHSWKNRIKHLIGMIHFIKHPEISN